MNNAALKLPNEQTLPKLTLVKGKKDEGASSYLRLVYILGFCLIAIQILDGVFTAMGIAADGINAEGNPLLHYFMQHFHYVNVLFVTKLSAITVIVGVCYSARYVNWVHYAMFTLIGIYIGAAILPWTYILFA